MAAARVSGFQNKGVIGKGAFGVVYLVENDAGRELALKVMEWRYADVTNREVAENELKVLKQLSHDHLIAYVGSFIQNGLLYIVTEYCAGGDLSGFLDAIGRPVPEDLLRVWLWQMACGLEFMHTHDPCILHRDLKPSNIYLTNDGIIRLGDMGIARALDHPGMMATTFCGTPPYMSPEALREDPYNAKTDMWALGCCVVEMATLDRAYDASSLLLLRDIVMKTRKPLPRPEYGGALDNLVSQMLMVDPDARTSSSELMDEWAMKEVEAAGAKPFDLLEKHGLLQCLAFHRCASPTCTSKTQLEMEEDTALTLPPSMSNLKLILSENGEAMTSYRVKVEKRIHGRDVDGTLINVETVIYRSGKTQKTKAPKKRISVGSDDTPKTSSTLSSSSTVSSTSSEESTMIRHTQVSSRPVLNSVTSSCMSSITSRGGLTLTPRDVTLSLSLAASGTDLSKSTIISTLMTVLKHVAGEDSFNSAVTLVQTSSNRQELVRDLQGILGNDLFQSIGSAITLLVLLQMTQSTS